MAGAYDLNADATKVLFVDAAGTPLVAAGATEKVQQRELIPVTATAAAGSGVTLTIPAPAAGVFNYLQYLSIVLYAAAALTAAATPNLVTTTNLPGNPVFTFPTAGAIGTITEEKYEGGVPIKGSAAATSITVVCPAFTSGIWRVNAAYFRA